MIDLSYMQQIAQKYGFLLEKKQLEQLNTYASFLVEYNKKVNLTTITQPKEICDKHFLDSLLLLSAVTIPVNATVIDVGTGAGFPSLPCKILRPDCQITLLDSLQKRIVFLEQLSQQLQQRNHCIHARAEQAAHSPLYRERFDIATARAVGSIAQLAEYCLGFLKQGGLFVALKGPQIESEIQESASIIEKMGGVVEGVKRYELPEGSVRNLVVIKKVEQTPQNYPRSASKIKKTENKK